MVWGTGSPGQPLNDSGGNFISKIEGGHVGRRRRKNTLKYRPIALQADRRYRTRPAAVPVREQPDADGVRLGGGEPKADYKPGFFACLQHVVIGDKGRAGWDRRRWLDSRENPLLNFDRRSSRRRRWVVVTIVAAGLKKEDEDWGERRRTSGACSGL